MIFFIEPPERPAITSMTACQVRARYMLQYYSSDLWGQESIVFRRFRLIYPICTGRKRSVTRVMSFLVRRIAAHGAVREYLARNSRRAFTQAPLSRVPARDFFEPDTVVPHGARDMQVPVHDRGGAVPDMPISGALGTAPLRELRVPQDPRWLPDEWKMVHEHCRQAVIALSEPALRDREPGRTPRFPAGIRIRVKQHLICAHHPGLVRPRETGLFGRRAVGPERVVVQQEERRDRRGPARAIPHGIGILRGEDAHVAAQFHQVLVALLAADLQRLVFRRPQLVVARRPHHLCEPPGQRAKCPADVGDPLTDIAGHQQPVARGPRPQLLGDLPVLRVTDVQVADGQQFRRRGGSRRHSCDRYTPTGALDIADDFTGPGAASAKGVPR